MPHLKDASQHQAPHKLGNVRDNSKRMALKLYENHFSNVMVIELFKRFISMTNIQEISKSKAYVALPSFFKEFGKDQFEAEIEMDMLEEGGLQNHSRTS